MARAAIDEERQRGLVRRIFYGWAVLAALLFTATGFWYADDQRLPPVRQLAADLGLANATVARAYQALESAGQVVTRRAAGTRVSAGERSSGAGGPDRGGGAGIRASGASARSHR